MCLLVRTFPPNTLGRGLSQSTMNCCVSLPRRFGTATTVPLIRGWSTCMTLSPMPSLLFFLMMYYTTTCFVLHVDDLGLLVCQ